MGKRWCLVLVLWGDAYSVAHVNALAGAALTLSTGCAEVVLLTDRPRPGLDIRVRAVPIPEFFDRPEFRRGGYVIKLSLFSRSVLPPDMPCVYLDLDTAVTGDLGRIAALVQDRNDIFMLPPGNLIGFGRLRRARFRLTRGRRMAVGNSSILAFHSAAEPNLADTFQRLYETGSGPAQVMNNDDRFISWFGWNRIAGVPSRLGVMFRREVLTRGRILGWLRNRAPWVRARRASIAAVTFNGAEHKPERLAALPDGALLSDKRGRSGRWSRAEIGPLKDRLACHCAAVVAGDAKG